MQIEHSVANGVTIVALKGRLDELAAPQTRETFTEIVPASDAQVLLDFTGVEYISSGGLRVVLMLSKAIRKHGGTLRLCGLNPFVTEVFTLSNLASLFEVYPTRAEATDAFQTQTPGL